MSPTGFRRGFAFVFTLLLCLILFGEYAKSQEKVKIAPIPPDAIQPLVISRPDCPLLIENVKLFYVFLPDPEDPEKLIPHSDSSFSVRNISEKEVTGFEFTWIRFGSSNSQYRKLEIPLRPSEVLKPEEPATEIVEPPQSYKEVFGNGWKSLSFFAITRITFADGTEFNDTERIERLSEHIMDIGFQFKEIPLSRKKDEH